MDLASCGRIEIFVLMIESSLLSFHDVGKGSSDLIG